MPATAFDQLVEAFSGKLSELKSITFLRLEGTLSPRTSKKFEGACMIPQPSFN